VALVEDRGRELSQETPGKPGVGPEGAAKCAAVGADSAPVDAELAEVIAAWPALPGDVKAGILTAVRGGTEVESHGNGT